jgi:hypothetical protein
MPNLSNWYPRKDPYLQRKILKSIALNGRLSQKEAVSQFNCKPSTISEAFKILAKRRKLIHHTNAPEHDNLNNVKRGSTRIKFYKLSREGLLAFINENPSPEEFWRTIIWFYSLITKDIDNAEFNRYYDLFIQKFVGSFPLRSCFFLGNFFDKLFESWRSRFDYMRHMPFGIDYRYNETEQSYKVLECLLLNRRITVEQICSLTQLTEEDVRKTIDDYSITPSNNNNYYYANLYESAYQSSRSINVTTDFLNHLIIAPSVEEKKSEEEEEEEEVEGKEEKNDNKKYELSLIGVLLMLAIKSLTIRDKLNIQSSANFSYTKIASNYKDKLPLIFGNWKLLRKSILDFDYFPSIFDYLFLDKSEILSLSVLLGGNKEIYDNVRSAALSTINKFFVVYDDGISAIQSPDCTQEFLNSKYYQFIQEKLREIEVLVRYTDLESFAKHMASKKPRPKLYLVSRTFKTIPPSILGKLYTKNIKQEDFSLENELNIIEKALADEFSFLFYIGLLRYNNHKASDYPLTTGFIRPNARLIYPIDFLMQIVKSDDNIRNTLTEWIKEAMIYQKLALDKMNQIYLEINNAGSKSKFSMNAA